jgi:eukaryotic-like serine/threonine-protein kinase
VLLPTKREGAAAARANRARFEPVPGIVVADKYRVERVLGEGGMGVVVAATHLGLDQRVAIKFLLPEAMRHKEAVERFQREAKVAAKVKSEHVARVHDVGALEGGEPFIVMEYLEGSDLRQLIKEGLLPISDACEIALQACEALAEVHAAGIVHRDLKPSNLFVTRRADGSPCVKLLDFGISKFNFCDDLGTDPALTATAAIMGSPSYMSPEQLKSSKEVDARTDVWSLGAVLYEALTGRPAFAGETVPQVIARIASDEPASPTSLRAETPAPLDRAILACLEKKPEKRAKLVDLARALVELAPERARVSLERIEAVLGEPPAEADGGDAGLPVLPLATSRRGRALSAPAWGGSGGGRRSNGALIVALVFALGLLGSVLYAGGIDLRALRGRVAGATSAAASVVGSALPSAFPAPSPIGSASVRATATPIPSASEPPEGSGAAATPSAVPSPAPTASDESDRPDEHESQGPPSAPTASVASTLAHPALPSGHSVPAPVRHHTAKPRHGANKVVRKHH